MGKTYDEDDLKRVAGIISEDFDSKLDTFLENMDIMIDKKIRPIIREELVEAKADIKTIKTAVTDTNKQVKDHERRIVRLEPA